MRAFEGQRVLWKIVVDVTPLTQFNGQCGEDMRIIINDSSIITGVQHEYVADICDRMANSSCITIVIRVRTIDCLQYYFVSFCQSERVSQS